MRLVIPTMRATSRLLRGAVVAVTCGASGVQAWSQSWVETGIPPPEEITTGGRFGASLSMHGNRLLVGAPGASAGAPGSGAAYLYDRHEGGENVWSLIKEFHSPSPHAGGAFGSVVVLEEDRAIVSAPGEPWPDLPVGAVHVFDRDLGGAEAWGHRQRITPDTVQGGMSFGRSFALADDLLIVNSPGYDGYLPELGAVSSFMLDADGSYQAVRFIPGDALVESVEQPPCVDDWMTVFAGLFVHASAPGAFISPIGPFGNASLPVGPAQRIDIVDDFGISPDPVFFARGTAGSGLLLVGVRSFPNVCPHIASFALDSAGGLAQEGALHPQDTIASINWWHWGDAVDIDGELVAVGAYGDDNFTPLGRVDLIVRDETAADRWSHLGSLSPTDPGFGDHFGRAVAVSNGCVAVGAPGKGDLDRGKVYVFHDPDIGIPDAVPAATDLCILPNPVDHAGGLVIIRPDRHDGPGRLTIFSALGCELLDRVIRGEEIVDVRGFPVGTYPVRFVPQDPDLAPRTARLSVAP